MLSHRSWTAESELRLIMALFFGLAAVGLVGELTRWMTAGLPEATGQLVTGSIGTLVMHAYVFGLVGWFVRANQSTWRSAFGFAHGPVLRKTLLGIVALPLVLPLTLGLQWASYQVLLWRGVEVVPQPAIKMLASAGEFWQRALLGLQTIVTAPLAEELLFRGILFVAVRQAGYPRLAFWGVAALFGLSHGNLLTFVPLVFFGLVLAWLYEHTDNLLTPIAAHAAFNAANFAWLLIDGGQ